MRWLASTLVVSCAALWIDALAGGGLIGSPAALIVIAALAFAAGAVGAVVPLAAAGVASAALLSVADQVYEPGRFGLASDGIFYCVVVFAPILLGFLIGSRNRQVAELRSRRHILEIERGAAMDAARAAERERLDRRIDLTLAARLRRIADDARSAQRCATAEPARVPALLEAVEDGARAALAELREVLGFLQHAGAQDVGESLHVPAPATAPAHRRRAHAFDRVDVALALAVVPLAVETSFPGHHGAAVANVVLSLAQGAALMVVRRWPIRGVIVLVGVATVQTAAFSPLPPTVSWLLPGLLAPFLLGHWPARVRSCLGFAVLVSGGIVITLATPAAHRASAGVLPSLVMGLLTWIGGRMLAAREARADELRAIAEELDRTRAQATHDASADQRAEMARDLHDAGAHALTVVCLQAGAARTWWDRDQERARLAMAALMSVVDGTLTQIGQSLDTLARDTGNHRLELTALDVLAGIGRALGLRVDVIVSGQLVPVGEDVAQVVYLVVQEALTNAARHATGSSVRVCLTSDDTTLEVRVTDTGPAIAATEPVEALIGSGFGLRGMRERVEALSGELTAAHSGRGFEILARLPS